MIRRLIVHLLDPKLLRMRIAAGLLCLLTSLGLVPPTAGETAFLTAQGDRLLAGDREFRFVSFNIPNLHLVEDNYSFDKTNPWRWPDEFEITDALETIRQMGGNVVRSYVISVRREDSDMGPHVHVLEPGKFNEEAFRVLDLVLKVASEKQIRVIVPFVDNWRWWGGIQQYAGFRGKQAKEFWTDPQLIDDFKQTIRHVVERRNTLTGKLYKDDPTIFGWETGNELDSPADWTREIAAYLKSLDANHLVIDGNSLHGVLDHSLADPNVDVVTSHHYPNVNASMATAVQTSIDKAEGKKPYFVGEFGFVKLSEVERILRSVSESGASGALLWSVRPHRREGGFYWHSEGAGDNLYKAYHWPGFDAGNAYEERDLLRLVRRFAFEVNGHAPSPPAVPASPNLLPIHKPGRISWQGSVGAAAYDVQRATTADGPWTTIGVDVSDAAVQYRPLFADSNAQPGSDYFYRILAKNQTGTSPPSNVVGPVKSDSQTIVDEFCETSHPTAELATAELAASRNIVGPVEWLTTSARPVQEDIHRLTTKGPASVTYDTKRPVVECRLLTFRKSNESPDPTFHISNERGEYQQVVAQRVVSQVSLGDYGYWLPTEYRLQPNRNTKSVRIKLAGDQPDQPTSSNEIQLSRFEIRCRDLP